MYSHRIQIPVAIKQCALSTAQTKNVAVLTDTLLHPAKPLQSG